MNPALEDELREPALRDKRPEAELVMQIRLRGSTVVCINVYLKEREHSEQEGDANKV